MPDGSTAWLVTPHAQARLWMRSPLLALDDIHAGDGYRGFSLPRALAANVQNRDGADHTRLRTLAAAPLAPRHIAHWDTRIRRIADNLARPIAARGGGELMGEFALPLALTVVCDMLGVPAHNRPELAEWTRTMLHPPRPRDLQYVIDRVQQLMARLIAQRRRAPRNDLITRWIATSAKGPGLGEDELVGLAFGMWWAGIENTAHLIGLSVLQVLRHPHTLPPVRHSPENLHALVEELLHRHGPALTSVRRFARRDITISGTPITAGDTVLFALTAGNRDPEHFRPVRHPHPHLAFGHGPHYCPGAALARTELRTALLSLDQHTPHLTLATSHNAAHTRRSLRLRGLTALPVTT
ncbi:cytochrome P450 [Streptomyces sp. CBMA152]|uniref:cytochrome P450 n=1 Tax=Streptomyces sp. CBMA152 TaxID=1896312 RepID=UPI001660A778|nr:cytochrome P450 [Streptomyces sp. CBMA152]